MDSPVNETTDPIWQGIYRVSGVMAILAVIVMITEMMVTFLPSGGLDSPNTITVLDWFTLFQNNPLMGLRNMGLLNIIIMVLMGPVFVAFYGVLQRANKTCLTIAVPLAFVGIAIYLAKYTGFSMLALSGQYAAATTPEQRSLLLNAGEAMLALGQGHTGAIVGFLLVDIAGLVISVVMLRSQVFSKFTAYAGILANAFFVAYEISSSFVPALFGVIMLFAIGGGLLTMLWDILLGRTLYHVGHLERKSSQESSI